MQVFIYKKIIKKKFNVVTYIWPTLFNDLSTLVETVKSLVYTIESIVNIFI